jgi:hypothetical protein
VRWIADENFNGRILSGLRRRLPDLDAVTVQELDLTSVLDPRVLERAAGERRVLLTHDHRTVPRFAYDRVAAGQPMPGVVVVPEQMPIGAAIEDLYLLIGVATPEDLRDRVIRLPL